MSDFTYEELRALRLMHEREAKGWKPREETVQDLVRHGAIETHIAYTLEGRCEYLFIYTLTPVGLAALAIDELEKADE